MKTLETLEQQTRDLEEKIEWHLTNMNLSPQGSRTYRYGEKIVRMYAKQYKELTGDWYLVAVYLKLSLSPSSSSVSKSLSYRARAPLDRDLF